MEYLIVKSIHIIFVVSYFAGLFYIVRLIIYHSESLKNDQGQKREILHNQFCFMQQRLWNIIIVPAFCIMLATGLYMVYYQGLNWFRVSKWFQFKTLALLVLAAYHFWCWRTLKELRGGVVRYRSVSLRMMNEVATIILFVVVFAVVLKDFFTMYWWHSIVWFFAMGCLIMAVVKFVNRYRKD